MATLEMWQAAVKGWCSYDQTGTPSVDDSYNVSSVTDNSAGVFTVNWNQDFANANYAAVAMSCDESVQGTVTMKTGTGGSHVAGSTQIRSRNQSETDVDRSQNSVIAAGDW